MAAKQPASFNLELDDGRVVQFDHEPDDAEIQSVLAEVSKPENLAEKASKFVSDPLSSVDALATPFSMAADKASQAAPSGRGLFEAEGNPARKARESTARAVNAYGAADKNFPTENIIPAALSTGLGIAGATTPIPGAAMGGAFLGGAAGVPIQEGISRLRGNQRPRTPMEIGDEALWQGTQGALGEALASAGGKTIEKIGDVVGAKKTAQEGLDTFTRQTADKYGHPLPKGDAGDIIKRSVEDQVKDAAASSKSGQDVLEKVMGDKVIDNKSEAADFVDFVFNKRGLQSKGKFREKLGELAGKNLSAEELKNIMIQLDEFEATRGLVKSDLKTVKAKPFEAMANVLEDLKKPDLTYSNMKAMREAIADEANFGSANRTSVEKLYGALYDRISKDMTRNAEKHGLGYLAHDADKATSALHELESHPAIRQIRAKTPEDVVNYLYGGDQITEIQKVMRPFDDEVRNTFRRSFMDKAIENSRDLANQGKIDPKLMAKELGGMSDEKIKAIFDTDANTIFAIRDIASTQSKKLATEFIEDLGREQYKNKVGAIKGFLNKWKMRGEIGDILESYGLGGKGYQDVLYKPAKINKTKARIAAGIARTPFSNEPNEK